MTQIFTFIQSKLTLVHTVGTEMGLDDQGQKSINTYEAKFVSDNTQMGYTFTAFLKGELKLSADKPIKITALKIRDPYFRETSDTYSVELAIFMDGGKSAWTQQYFVEYLNDQKDLPLKRAVRVKESCRIVWFIRVLFRLFF